MDVAQALEDLLEDLVSIQKAISKLKTVSVSGQSLRKLVKDANKQWLPISGIAESVTWLTRAACRTCLRTGKRLTKLADNPSQRSQYKPLLKAIITATEGDLPLVHQGISHRNVDASLPQAGPADIGS